MIVIEENAESPEKINYSADLRNFLKFVKPCHDHCYFEGNRQYEFFTFALPEVLYKLFSEIGDARRNNVLSQLRFVQVGNTNEFMMQCTTTHNAMFQAMSETFSSTLGTQFRAGLIRYKESTNHAANLKLAAEQFDSDMAEYKKQNPNSVSRAFRKRVEDHLEVVKALNKLIKEQQ